jgi:hypothetical protein
MLLDFIPPQQSTIRMIARSTLQVDERHGQEVARYAKRGMVCDVALPK